MHRLVAVAAAAALAMAPGAAAAAPPALPVPAVALAPGPGSAAITLQLPAVALAPGPGSAAITLQLPAAPLPVPVDAPVRLPPPAPRWEEPADLAPAVPTWLQGRVVPSDLEGPHLELETAGGHRYALFPVPGVDLAPWVGQQVAILAAAHRGPTIFQRPALMVYGVRAAAPALPGPADDPVRLPEIEPAPPPAPPGAPPVGDQGPVGILPVPHEPGTGPAPGKEPRRVEVQPWPPAAPLPLVTVRVVVRGLVPAFDTPPLVRDGRTLVPVRAVAELLGARVEWDGPSRTVTITTPHRSVRFRVEVPEAVVHRDGDTLTVALDVAPIIVDSRLLVPLRALSEALGYQVRWDEATRTVEVN